MGRSRRTRTGKGKAACAAAGWPGEAHQPARRCCRWGRGGGGARVRAGRAVCEVVQAVRLSVVRPKRAPLSRCGGAAAVRQQQQRRNVKHRLPTGAARLLGRPPPLPAIHVPRAVSRPFARSPCRCVWAAPLTRHVSTTAAHCTALRSRVAAVRCTRTHPRPPPPPWLACCAMRLAAEQDAGRTAPHTHTPVSCTRCTRMGLCAASVCARVAACGRAGPGRCTRAAPHRELHPHGSLRPLPPPPRCARVPCAQDPAGVPRPRGRGGGAGRRGAAARRGG